MFVILLYQINDTSVLHVIVNVIMGCSIPLYNKQAGGLPPD